MILILFILFTLCLLTALLVEQILAGGVEMENGETQ